MANANVLGHVVWHELMTTDLASAGTFYGSITGWKNQLSPHDPEYRVFTAGGRSVAGLMILPEEARQMGAPPNWLTYFATPDVDETVRRTVALGGRVLVPAIDVRTVGRFAVLRDPQGAAFAVIALTQPAPVSDERPPVGDFSWHELATTDSVSAWKFYSELFGWKATHAMDMGPAGTYQMFGLTARSVGGMFTKPKEMPGPAAWLPYIRVTDAVQIGGRIAGLGGKVLNGPMEVPDGDWIVTGRDPQGAVFAAHSVKVVATPAAKSVTKKPSARKPVAKKPTVAKVAAKKSAVKKAGKKSAKRATTSAAKKAVKKAVKKVVKKAAKKTAKKAAKPASRTGVVRPARPKMLAKKAAKKR